MINLPPGIPRPEEFDKIDKLTREQWRIWMVNVFVPSFGLDLIQQIVAEGRRVWRSRSHEVMANHAMREEDVDWIFDTMRAYLRRQSRFADNVEQAIELSKN